MIETKAKSYQNILTQLANETIGIALCKRNSLDIIEENQAEATTVLAKLA